MINNWNVTFLVFRQKGQGPAHFDTFKLEVNPDEYVLDAVERIWSFHDRSLTFAHACHHSTCGACGMRVNGVEKLTCITPIRSVTDNGGTVKIEPMRNFPVVSDLVVDTGVMFRRMDAVGHRSVLPLAQEPAPTPAKPPQKEDLDTLRLADCIECGLCISACPIALTTPAYLGPAVLAGAQQHGLDGDRSLLALVDCGDGVWRCHSAFECSAVCPSNVDPARKIMDLRKQVIRARINNFFRRD
jgi:succinate dehydrogenase/fumarate reductase iron-sulfur protein